MEVRNDKIVTPLWVAFTGTEVPIGNSGGCWILVVSSKVLYIYFAICFVLIHVVATAAAWFAAELQVYLVVRSCTENWNALRPFNYCIPCNA